jgi:hypothetical protein
MQPAANAVFAIERALATIQRQASLLAIMTLARKPSLSFSPPVQGDAGALPLSMRLAEAQRAFARYHASCFWSSPAGLVIDPELIPWVASELRKHGDREAFAIADRLQPCR